MGGKISMFKYVKMLQYPINIKKKDVKMAKYIISQYGGPYYKWDFHLLKRICTTIIKF